MLKCENTKTVLIQKQNIVYDKSFINLYLVVTGYLNNKVGGN